MTLTVAVTLVVLALMAGGAFGYAMAAPRRRSLEVEVARLQERAGAADGQLRNEQAKVTELTTEVETQRRAAEAERTRAAGLEASLKAEQEKHEEKLTALQEAELRLKESFDALSLKALENNTASFLQLAGTHFEKVQEAARAEIDKRREAVDNLVKPISETLTKVDEKLQQAEKDRVTTAATLTEHLRHVTEAQQKLNAETANLVKALRAPAVRGRWGEIQLKRVVELAGMLEYCDFLQQESVATEGGSSLRPDMLIRLPSGRRIVVDSKVPLSHYLDALETEDEELRAAKLRLHSDQVRRHVNALSSKAYWDALDETPEFVILFLPGETFYSAALEQDPSLIELGPSQRVLLATPTTLIALLKAVHYGWRQESIAQNAKEISNLGKQLYERIRVMANHLTGVGRGLERALDSYNSGVGSLERSVLPAARRFRELGSAAGAEIAALEPLDKVVRPITAGELLSAEPTENDHSPETDDDPPAAVGPVLS